MPNAKSWSIIVNPSNPHKSKIFYKGDKVGYLRSMNFGIDIDHPIPYITISILTQDIEIITEDIPPV